MTGFVTIFFWDARIITHFIKNDDGHSQAPFDDLMAKDQVKLAEAQAAKARLAEQPNSVARLVIMRNSA